MATDFSFKGDSGLLAALSQSAARKRELEIQQEQAQQQRMGNFLNNLQSIGTLARTGQQIKQGNAEAQQLQSQQQGQQNLATLLSQSGKPVEGPQLPTPGPVMGEQPNPTYNPSPQDMRQAVLQASPTSALPLIAKQTFPDEGDLALKKLREQSLVLGNQTKQQNLTDKALASDPTSPQAVQMRNMLSWIIGKPIPPNLAPKDMFKIASAAMAGDKNAAIKELSDARNMMAGVAASKFVTSSVDSGPGKVAQQKIDNGILGRQILNAGFDPNTGNYDLSKVNMNELAISTARMLNPQGVVSDNLRNEINQKTAEGALSYMGTALGLDPSTINGAPQSVIKMYAGLLDREGTAAQNLRDTYVNRNLDMSKQFGFDYNPADEGVNMGNDYVSVMNNSADHNLLMNDPNYQRGMQHVVGSFRGTPRANQPGNAPTKVKVLNFKITPGK